MTATAEYLARVGFVALLGDPTPIICDDEDDPATYAAFAAAAAHLADNRRVGALLREKKPESRQHYDGVAWLRLITWPDRVPELKTWAGQMTLAKIIRDRQSAMGKGQVDDLLAFRAPMKSASGFDGDVAQNAIDIGFSPAALDIPIVQRPAMELLAIVGLETVPLVSFGRRDCGFIHDGRLWRFTVEERDGGYLHRWGPLSDQGEVQQQISVGMYR